MIIGEKECKEALENLRTLERDDNFKKWGGQVAPQISCDIFEQLIEKYFKSKENTLEFKNFRLHADSTLKNMPKDELISYIHMLHHNWGVSDEQLFNVIEINITLQNELDAIKKPHPYKFEELKKGMWVWMVWFKEGAEKGKFAKILNTYTIPPYYHNDEDGEEHERVEFRIGDGSGAIDFDAWKFYPPTKAMEYQE